MHGRMQWFGVDVLAPPRCHPEGVIDASDMRKGEVPMNPGIRRGGYLFARNVMGIIFWACIMLPSTSFISQ